MSASTCRSAAISSLHADGNYSKNDDLHIGGYRAVEAAARAGAGERRSGHPRARRPQGQAAQHRRPHRRCRRRRSLMSMATSTSASRSVITTPNTACRSASRSIRRSRPKRRRSTRTRTAPTCAPNVPHRRLLQACSSCAAAISKYHHDELEADGEVGSQLLHQRRRMRAELVQTDAAAGAGPAASSISSQDARIRGDEKYLPDSRKRQIGLFTLQTLVSGPVRFEGGAAGRIRRASTPTRTRRSHGSRRAGDRRQPTPPRAQLHRRSPARLGANYEIRARLARRPVALAQRARAGDRGTVRRTARTAAASSSSRRSRPRAGEEQRGRAQRAPHDRAGPRPGQRLLQPLLELHLPGADRRDRATGCPVYEYRQGKADYYGFELQGDAKFGKALGIDWGGELGGRCGARDDQGLRPGAADPAASRARRR